MSTMVSAEGGENICSQNGKPTAKKMKRKRLFGAFSLAVFGSHIKRKQSAGSQQDHCVELISNVLGSIVSFHLNIQMNTNDLPIKMI